MYLNLFNVKVEDEIEQTEDTDRKSVYVKNVEYMATKEEVVEHFKDCGKISRVTILTDKYTGHPKGYAYIEFEDFEGAENAKILNDSLLKGRQIKVMPKRTNVPFRGRRPMRKPRGFNSYGYRGGGGGGGGGGYYYRGYNMFSGHSRGMRRGFKPY